MPGHYDKRARAAPELELGAHRLQTQQEKAVLNYEENDCLNTQR